MISDKMLNNKPAITLKTFEENAKKWLQIPRFNESGLVINFVGDHYYTIPQLLNDKNLLKKILGKYYNRYIFIYVELFPQTSIDFLKDLLLKTIKLKKIFIPDIEALSFSEILDKLIVSGYEIAFFISKTEPLFITKNQLLYETENIARDQRVSFLYFSETNLTNPKFHKQQNEFSTMFQNVIFQPIYGREDVFSFIEYNEKLWKISMPEDLKRRIIEECGGNLWLIRQAVRYYRNNPKTANENIFSHYEILSKAFSSWNQLFKDEQDVAKGIILGNKSYQKYNSAFEYLIKIGFLVKGVSSYTLSIPLLRKVIKQNEIIEGLSIKDGVIFIGNKVFSELLTENEEKILKYFLSNKNRIISREEISKIIWKNEDDYSDWALDQIMSRLRKKLEEDGMLKNILRTKKGVGYVFSA